MPAMYCVDFGDGPPFSVKRYNKNVRMAARDAAGCAYIGSKCATSVGELGLSKSLLFVCYVQPTSASSAVGHFFADKFNLGEDEA